MAVICFIRPFSSALGCAKGGITSIKTISFSGINIVAMNAAVATYMNLTNYEMTAIPMPVIAGNNWVEHTFDGLENPFRKSVMPQGKLYAEIEIGSFRFNGKQFTKFILDMRECCNLVTATRYADGTIFYDGIEFDQVGDRFLVTPRLRGLTMGDIEHTSGNGDDGEIQNTKFTIKGKTPQAGFTTLTAWTALV